MKPITLKRLVEIVNELNQKLPPNTLVLVPTTKLLDQMTPLLTVGNNVEVYQNSDKTYSVASTEDNYSTKQLAIVLC